MSKYGSALGVWDLKIGRTEEQGPLQLHPSHKDNRTLLSLVMDNQIKTNPNLLLDRISDFLKKLIRKEYPPENEQEELELDAYVDSNLLELMNETLVTFKLAKKEDLEAQKKDMLQSSLGKP